MRKYPEPEMHLETDLDYVIMLDGKCYEPAVEYYKWFDGKYWLVEFKDINGVYRSWKQQFDGGELMQIDY